MENSQLYNIKTRNNSNLFQPSSFQWFIRKDHIILASRCLTSFPL